VVRRGSSIVLMAGGIAVLTACDSGNSTKPQARTVPSCGPVTGKGGIITIGAAEWVLATTLQTIPDTSTRFSGTATLTSPVQISNVNPGDTVTVQLVFADSLGIRAAGLPYVAISVGGGNQGGFVSAASYFTLDQQGTWGLQTLNTGVYGANAGVINGYWLHTDVVTPAAGEELYCVTSQFAVPASLGNVAVAPGQTIPVSFVYWYVVMPGDQTASPTPVVAR
jgi:hypothetical protein